MDYCGLLSLEDATAAILTTVARPGPWKARQQPFSAWRPPAIAAGGRTPKDESCSRRRPSVIPPLWRNVRGPTGGMRHTALFIKERAVAGRRIRPRTGTGVAASRLRSTVA